MKKIIIYLLLPILILPSCDENMPVIPPLGPRDAGNRVVLVEEFTGNTCPNCPDGSKEIENLLSLYPNNLVAVSIHAGPFAIPHPESQYDFRTDEGEALQNFLGVPLGYPSAIINRKDHGGGGLQKTQEEWAGLILKDIEEEPLVGLNVQSAFDPDNRNLEVTVTIVPNQTIAGEARLTVMITEDNIIDLQIDEKQGKIPDYMHKHVFRTTLTNTTGDVLNETLNFGEIIEKKFSYQLPGDWVAANCQAIAFVSRGGNNKEVLQAGEVKVVE